jgi:hypothetical protein
VQILFTRNSWLKNLSYSVSLPVIVTSVLVNIGFLRLPSVLNDTNVVTLLITVYTALQILFEFYAFTPPPPLSEHFS